MRVPMLTSDGHLVISWMAPQGHTYGLEYKTNLGQAAWSSLGIGVTTSNAIALLTNSIGADKQRFYRVKQR